MISYSHWDRYETDQSVQHDWLCWEFRRYFRRWSIINIIFSLTQFKMSSQRPQTQVILCRVGLHLGLRSSVLYGPPSRHHGYHETLSVREQVLPYSVHTVAQYTQLRRRDSSTCIFITPPPTHTPSSALYIIYMTAMTSHWSRLRSSVWKRLFDTQVRARVYLYVYSVLWMKDTRVPW